MKKRLLIFGATFFNISLLTFIAGYVLDSDKNAVSADKIFINGKIITVDSANSIVEAIAIKDGKITAAGYSKEILKLRTANTIVEDLKGRTVVPGFIDGHSHFMSFDWASNANVSAPPVGPVKNISDLVKEIQKFKQEKNIPDGRWITAFGYDVDQLEEKRHITRDDLDAAFPNTPVSVTHVSGHMVVANSAALKLSGIDATTKDPPGGLIVRKDGSDEPTGLLQENAGRLLKRPAKKTLTLDEQFLQLKNQQELYASNGITTAQDGYSTFESVELLSKAAAQNQLFIDIESLPGYQVLDKVLVNPSVKFNILNNHLKFAGFKLVSDGSPQGKTAFFTKPYLTEVPGCTHDTCSGFPNITQQQFNDAILKGIKNDVRTFVHCNGDAAIDMYIAALENGEKELNTAGKDRRPVVIHSQFVRPDQLDKYKQLGVVPAFFSNHAFFWGDVHTRNLGKERASFLSPLKSALKKNIIATDHTDWGVTPLNQLFLLWTAVARESRTGQLIGGDERLSPLEALRTITINGAYEYKEEKIKGSIEKGKLADLVIISDDITTIDAAKIKDITVLETIKEGKTIYKKK